MRTVVFRRVDGLVGPNLEGDPALLRKWEASKPRSTRKVVTDVRPPGKLPRVHVRWVSTPGMLTRIARNIAMCHRFREKGRIEWAVRHEMYVDKLHRRLPTALRW